MNRRSTAHLSVVPIAVVLSLCGTAHAVDWPHWRGPNYNGISDETGWNAKWPGGGPKVLWTADIGIGFSAVVVSDGKAYTMGNADDKDTVFCFNAETGKKVWTYSYPEKLDPKYYEGGTLASPTVADGKLYTISKYGKAFCLDAGSGKVIWKTDLLKNMGFKRTTWGFSGSPFISGDLVIFNVGSKGVALDKTNGKLVWENGKGAGGYATLVPYKLGGRKCLALFGSQGLVGLDAAKGEELWNFEWKTKYDVNAADPIIVGDRIFISSGYGTGCALLKISADRATQVWRNTNMGNKMNGCVHWQGHIYGVSENGNLKCLDIKTGDEVWSQGGFGSGSLSMAGGKLLVLGDKGTLVVAPADPGGYEPISSAKILSGRCWTVPVLANGRLYTHESKGHMVCLDLK